MDKFYKSANFRITQIENSLGILRQKDGSMWGWDLMLNQYLLLLLPFINFYSSPLLLISNENSTNSVNRH